MPDNKFLIKLFFAFIMLLCVIATQYYAYLVDYHKALGHVLIQTDNYTIYQPFAFIFWFISFYDITPVALDKTTDILMYCSLSFIFFITLYSFKNNKPVLDLHGTAAWAETETEVIAAKLLPEKKEPSPGRLGQGMFLGRWEGKYLQHDGLEHAIIMAPTRSGKGVALIVPTLLSWRHSTIVMDIKGENWGITAGFRKFFLKHKVLHLDLADSTKLTCRFNPLSEIRIGTAFEIPDTQIVAKMLIESGKPGDTSYWEKAASSFVTGVITHLLYTKKMEGKEACLGDILSFLNDPSMPLEQVLANKMLVGQHVPDTEEGRKMLRQVYGSEVDPEYPLRHPRVAECAAEMLNKADKERASVMSSVTTPLALFQDPIIRRNTATSDFKILDLMNHDVPVDLYLVISPDQLLRLMPFMRILISQIVSRLAPKMKFDSSTPPIVHKHRMLLLLDEFPALGNLDTFEAQLAFIAGFGMKAFLIVQSLNQINKIYTDKNSIFDNCHITVFYAPNDPLSAEMISKRLGNKTVEVISESWSGSKYFSKKNYSKSQQPRPLLTPDEVSRLAGDKKIIFVTGNRPICCDKNFYYEDPNFIKRYSAAKAPEVSDYCISDEEFKASRELDKAFE